MQLRVSSMDLATLFKLSIYLLTAFVGVVLGTAEGGWIPFVSLPMAILGYWWSEGRAGPDRTQVRGLGEVPSVVLGCLSLVAAAVEFFGDNPEGKLLSGIHLVVYLTWIVLLQRKQNSRYWQLLVLGVLQVAVASVLTNGSWFGLSVIGYLVAATWTMSVFSLYRAIGAFAGDGRLDARPDRSALANSTANREGLTPAAASVGRRSAPGPHADPQREVSQAFSTVCHDDDSRGVTMRFLGGVAFTSMLGLFVGTLFFILIPRIWIGTSFGLADNELPPTLRMTVTGLATEIRLGDMRQVLESNDPVLSLRLFDHQTNQPLDPDTYADWLGHSEPLFRGVILTDYEGGRWRPHRLATEHTAQLFPVPDDHRVPRTAAGTVIPTVRQEIHLDQNLHDILFCMDRAVAMTDDIRETERYRCGRRQLLNDIVVRQEWFKKSSVVDYIAFSELPAPEARREAGYVASKLASATYQYTNYFDRCREVPDGLERLSGLAFEVVATEEQRTGRTLTDLEKARVIESHLRDSRIYAYSLSTPQNDPRIEPVEDFLFNHRAGHCQYFASALGLMLRSVGIPARLVTGFKGGEHRTDGLLHVEKRFAHAWVEAWVDDKKWVTLDATPEAERTASVTQVGNQRSLWAAISSRLSGVWESNVLNVSLDLQEDLIYGPARELAISFWWPIRRFIVSPRASLVGFALFMINPRNWLTLRGSLTLGILFCLLWLLRRGSLRLGWTGWGKRSGAAASRHRRVEFYERFVRLMQLHGHERRPAQTQGEFVQDVAGSLAIKYHDTALTRGLAPIGDLFYRVRFGDEELPAQEASHLDALLADLEQTLGPATNNRAASRWRMPWTRDVPRQGSGWCSEGREHD